MLKIIWMGLGFVVSAVVIYLIVQEIIRSVRRSNKGEKSDYDFDID